MNDESRQSDEPVSAYLDGEATPAEIAEVERDNALLARVERLRAVRDAMAAPVPPMSAERRDQMISAALEVADAEAAERREAKIIPLHRPRQTLLAVAAAAVVLAAVVSAGLIASRGGDDADQTAAGAPAAVDDADTSGTASAAEAAPAEADMAMAEEAMAEEAMAEEAMAEEAMAEEAMAEEAMAEEAMAEEAMAEEAMATMETAEPESAMEAPAAEMVDHTAATASSDAGDTTEPERETEEERLAADGSALQAVDLGTLADLESLFDGVGARLSAALADDAMTDPGSCSAAVHEHVLESSAETLLSFVATVDTEDPLAIDAQLARLADGTGLIAYAATPGCEIEIHKLGPLDDP